MKIVNSNYQQAILDGRQRLSNSDLRGAARAYAGDYARSRLKVLQRFLRAGGSLLVGGRGGAARMPSTLRELERLEPEAFRARVYITDDDAPWTVWDATLPN